MMVMVMMVDGGDVEFGENDGDSRQGAGDDDHNCDGDGGDDVDD